MSLFDRDEYLAESTLTEMSRTKSARENNWKFDLENAEPYKDYLLLIATNATTVYVRIGSKQSSGEWSISKWGNHINGPSVVIAYQELPEPLSIEEAQKLVNKKNKVIGVVNDRANRKMERQLIDGLLYAPQLCGTEKRLNPVYDATQYFTVTKCNNCGEYYEADKEHICRFQNSYPDIKTETEE